MRRASVLAAFAALASLLAAVPAPGATYTVNNVLNNADAVIDGVCDDGSGHCTLRAALQEAAAGTGGDTIAFSISGNFVLGSTPFPSITKVNTTVDGSGQTVTIVGNSGVAGFVLTSSGNTLRALRFSGFSGGDAVTIPSASNGNTLDGLVISSGGTGVSIAGSSNVVRACRIGTDAAGMAAAGNSTGIHVTSGVGNVIGGTAPGDGNLISGNSVGIWIDTMASSGTIAGNYVGTNLTGTAAIANQTGIYVAGDAWTVGGTAAGAGNLVSGNAQSGIRVVGTAAVGNLVAGNVVGLAADGATVLGDGLYGIAVQSGAKNTTIGGTIAAARNVVSGVTGVTQGFGIYVTDSATGATTVQGNYVGTDVTGLLARGNLRGIVLAAAGVSVGGGAAGARNVVGGNGIGIEIQALGSGATLLGNFIGVGADGTTPVPNLSDGVYVWYNSSGNTIGGGGLPGTANVIAYNTSAGVNIYPGGTAAGNEIAGNSIHDNGYMAIDLGNDGATANDPCDADTGPNDLQNFPVVTSAVYSAGATLITGTLNSKASTGYRIEVYASPSADAHGNGQGTTLLDVTSLVTDASCNGTWNLSVGGSLTGQAITALAIDPAHNTSEFSAPFTATPVTLTAFGAD